MKLTKVLKTSFVAGLILMLPLAITLFIFRFLFNWALGQIDPLVRAAGLAQYTANIELAAQVLTIVVIVGAITLVGLVLQLNVGHRTFGEIGKIVNFLPLFRTVYISVRQVANSFVERSDTYESAVFVEYPREGMYFIGFITGNSPEQLHEIEGQSVYNVYLPASPNPTAGNLALVPEERIYESELTVRQGIRLLMTTGTATTAEEMDELTGGGLDLPEDDDVPPGEGSASGDDPGE